MSLFVQQFSFCTSSWHDHFDDDFALLEDDYLQKESDLNQNFFGKKSTIFFEFKNSKHLKLNGCDRWNKIERLVDICLQKNPLNADATYIACPWDILYLYFLNTKLTIVQRRDAEQILVQLDNLFIDKQGFIVCWQYRTIPFIAPWLRKIGIKTVFTPGASNNKADEIKDLDIIPFPYPANIEPFVQENKDILYSFIGISSSHLIRSKLFAMKHPENCVMINRTIDKVSPEEYKTVYADILSRSRYSLCPRGWQPNSYRFYESLGFGAIPILISDEAVLPTLPKDLAWEQCIIRVNEDDIYKIPDIVKSINPTQEQTMRENCLKAYAAFSGDNLVRVIREYFEFK